jgi:hypothetical protein
VGFNPPATTAAGFETHPTASLAPRFRNAYKDKPLPPNWSGVRCAIPTTLGTCNFRYAPAQRYNTGKDNAKYSPSRGVDLAYSPFDFIVESVLRSMEKSISVLSLKGEKVWRQATPSRKP